MTTMYTDDQDTIYVVGTLTARSMQDLRRMVDDAFRRRGEPLAALTLAFGDVIAIDDEAIAPLRAALADAVAVCAERNAALRIVPSSALRRLAT